ncbi:MAG: hypothetical protein ACREQX_04360 [Candidatus Binataceae bacterium]
MEDEALRLDALQRDLLLAQIDAFVRAVPDETARAPYLALRAAVAAMEVPAALAERLGAVAELALTSGRVRNAHGPGAELSLWSLFQKTPRGREIAGSVAALNAALKQIEGQPLEFVSAAMRAPGAYALTIKTAQCQLVMRFESAGVRVESVEVDLA